MLVKYCVIRDDFVMSAYLQRYGLVVLFVSVSAAANQQKIA